MLVMRAERHFESFCLVNFMLLNFVFTARNFVQLEVCSVGTYLRWAGNQKEGSKPAHGENVEQSWEQYLCVLCIKLCTWRFETLSGKEYEIGV